MQGVRRKGAFLLQIRARSDELGERAVSLMPGGHSNLRAPVGVRPLFIERGEGAHLFDADGNEYVDFMCGAGPGILGYSNPEYVQTLQAQLGRLYYLVSGAAQTPLEIDVAERFAQHVACAERVRFCLSGTEAVQLALRLSRAYTGRPRFVRFEGHYHGWLDNVLGGVVDGREEGGFFAAESDRDPLGTEGRFPGALRESFKIPWNDAGPLEEVLEIHGREIAVVLMEPILCNAGCCPPRPGYLERVRELCTRHGVLLCFDEVITGFRVDLRGAQGVLGVTPDLATFGKALAGGLPMGAVAGKKEIMNLLLERRVVGAGTFNGYPLGMAAAKAALSILERDGGGFYGRIDAVQTPLMEGLLEVARRQGIPALAQGPRGVFFFQFIDRERAYSVRDLQGADLERQNRFRTLMAEQGVLIMWGGRWYVSGAHTEKDVSCALEAAERAMKALR